MYETAVHAKDSIQYTVRKVQISDYALWTYQCLSNFSDNDELNTDFLQQLILSSLFEWHFNFFTYNWEAFEELEESIDSAEKAQAIHQSFQMCLCNHNVEILWSYCRERESTLDVYKNWCNHSLITSQKCAWDVSISEINVILLMLHKTLC